MESRIFGDIVEALNDAAAWSRGEIALQVRRPGEPGRLLTRAELAELDQETLSGGRVGERFEW